WPGRRWGVHKLVDDWICAHEYIHGRRPDVDATLDGFAETLLARGGEGAVDEIVVVGHSRGAMLRPAGLLRHLARAAAFGRRDVATCILTIGATIPKFALHPRAQGPRRKIARIVAEPSIAWVEYQSRADAISFYKFDPVSLRHIPDDRLDGKP